jgi:hypothetical protein
MARETLYIVQSYIAGKGKGLKAEPQISFKSAEAALTRAGRLGPTRLGVVAFSTSADSETGDYDENPVILFRTGQLPPLFDELS